MKIGFALGYDGMGSETLCNIRKSKGDPLCPLKGKQNMRRFLTCVPLEVKTLAGNWMYSEARLFVFSSAVLQVVEKWISTQPTGSNQVQPKKSNRKQSKGSKQEAPIMVALSVHSHHWQYYIICRQATVQQDSETPFLVYGPWPAGQTTTLLGVFKLVKFIDVLRKWVAEKWIRCFETATGTER